MAARLVKPAVSTTRAAVCVRCWTTCSSCPSQRRSVWRPLATTGSRCTTNWCAPATPCRCSIHANACLPQDNHPQAEDRSQGCVVDQIGDAKRRSLSILDRVFPEYETLFSDVFIKSSRALLQQATTAAEFADADLAELTAVLKQKSRGRLGAEKAEALQLAAHDSLGITRLGGVASFELRALLDQIALLEHKVAAIEQQIETRLAEIAQHVTEIKGISPVMAASLIAEIGDVQRFRRFESLVAYSGIDPSVFASGEFKATETHMSKRGSPHLRRALWLSAITASQSTPDLGEDLQRRLAEGKPWGTAMGAVARKLLSRIYVILRDNRPYEVR